MDSVKVATKGISKGLSATSRPASKESPSASAASLGAALARLQGPAAVAEKPSAPTKRTAGQSAPARTELGVQLAATGFAPKKQNALPSSTSTWGRMAGFVREAAESVSPNTVAAAVATPEDSRTYVEDGITYQETTTHGRNSSEIVTRTYESEGVSYTEVTTTQPSGDQRIVVDATQGDRTERTTTEVREVDGNLEDYVGDELGASHYDEEAERGPTTMTSSSTVVIDNSQDPPQRVVVNESTSYSQHIPANPDELVDGQIVDLESGINLAGNPLSSLIDQEVDWDSNASGQTLTVTRQSQLNAQGETVQTSSLTSDFRLVGRGEDGQELVVSNAGTLVFDADGREIHFSSVKEERGLIPHDEADNYVTNNIHSDADAFGERLLEGEGDYLNVRQSYSQDLTTGEEIFVQELGDYDNPRADGRTVTSVSNGEVTSVSYRLVSDGGDHVQQQTVVPGTDYSSVTETTFGDDGAFDTNTRTVANGEVSESGASRELLFERGERLPALAPAGYDQQQWDRFREMHPEGPVYLDLSTSESRDKEGVLVERSETHQHSVGASSVGSVEREADGSTTQAQLYQLGGDSPEAAILMADGSAATIDSDGTIRIDGQVVNAEPGSSGLPGALAGVGSGAQGLSQLTGVLRHNPALAESLGATRILGPLSAAVSFQSLLSGGSFSESTTSVAGLAGGLSGTLTAFGSAARAAKGLGFVGGGLTAGVGIYELTQGEYAEGAADLVAGGAAVAALIVGATPVGWALAGVAGLATAVRFFLDFGDEEAPPHAPLEF